MTPDNLVTVRTERYGDLVSRYTSGEFDAVWREIRSHRCIDGDFRAEVFDVAKETMKRAARNADLLAERLQAKDWKPLCGALRTAPSRQLDATVGKIEAVAKCPLPPTLVAFWSEVGGVDFVWNYKSGEAIPGLGLMMDMDEMDPLCVYGADEACELLEFWEDQEDQKETDGEPLLLELAPDVYHKANFSGGASYGIELPFLGADPIFANERHGAPFVDYLRLCFHWAGFPGLDQYAHREDVRYFVATFGAGLEPF
jgi:hypothetical protein